MTGNVTVFLRFLTIFSMSHKRTSAWLAEANLYKKISRFRGYNPIPLPDVKVFIKNESRQGLESHFSYKLQTLKAFAFCSWILHGSDSMKSGWLGVASLHFRYGKRKCTCWGLPPIPPTYGHFVGYFKGFFADSTSTKKAIQSMKLRSHCYPNNLLKSLLSFLSLWASSFFAQL